MTDESYDQPMWHLVADDYVITVDPIGDPDIDHSHHAIQLCFAIDDRVSVYSNGELTCGPVVCIAPDVAHRTSGAAVHFLCEPESARGRRLLGLLADTRSVAGVRSVHLAPIRAAVRASATGEAVRRLVLSAVDEATHGVDPVPELDPRIVDTLARLAATDGRTPPLSELAAAVHLSPSRLRHLFVEEVGIPIRAYVVWRRSLDAVRSIVLTDERLAGVAHGSGFADQAAFSRTYRRQFGRPPSRFASEAAHLRPEDAHLAHDSAR